MHAETRICIVIPSLENYSETFIHAHFLQLPNVKLCLHGNGDYFPTHIVKGERISNKYPFRRLLYKVVGFYRQDIQQKVASWMLAKYLRQNRINVLIAEYGPTAAAVLESSLMANVALVAHFHGYDAHDYECVRKYKKDYSRLFQMAVPIITASQHMKERLIELGASPDQVFVNPYGIDLKFFSASTHKTEPHFISIGRFVDKKAPHLTLLAFYHALKQQPDCKLVMVGDGPLQECCRQMVAALGIGHAVTFKGVCSPHEIKSLLHSSRAILQHSTQTSYGDSESLGVVFLEAAACGVPAITTRHNGIPEAVIHEKTGLLVDEFDIDRFSSEIVRLARDPEFAIRLGKAARAHVEEKFGLQQSLRGLSRVIDYALSSR